MNTLGDRPILLISPGGMLGRAWKRLLEERDIAHTAVGRPDIDLADEASIRSAITDAYSTVVNCAAYTNVDGAEEDEATATAINGTGVGWLAQACDAAGAKLVHYSTDYVFDGHGTSPYPIDHAINPINAYGRSKAVGEAAVLDANGPHLIVRTSWVYAPWGSNFVRTIHRVAQQRDELPVVDDQRGRPTSAEHLAEATSRLLEAGAAGLTHVTDGGECTWFGFAQQIARHANPGCRVEPCTTADFPRPAERPPYSVLDLSVAEGMVGPMPAWQDNLASVLNRLEADPVKTPIG